MAFQQDTDTNKDYTPSNPPPPPDNPSTGSSPYDTVAGYYRTYLGREGGQGEINGWVTNQNLHGTDQIETAIKNSAEAKAYAAKQAQTQQKPAAADYIKQWQASHSTPDLNALVADMKARGYNVSNWTDPTYGVSKNEISLDGQKYKVMGGENGSNPFWYTAGSDDSGGNRNGTFETFGTNGSPNPLPDYLSQIQEYFNSQKDPDQTAKMDQLLQTLTDRSNQSLNIDPTTDPVISGQVNAARVQQERQRTNMLNDMAESSNPYATGAMNNARVQSAEHVGTNISNLQSQLMQNELTARRSEIAQALQESGSLLTSGQQLALQRQLATLDSAIKNRGLDQSNNQFFQNLMLQRMFLNSQNDQFAATFGLNSADNRAYWDWVNSHNPSNVSK
jgi:hypothetical protein